MKSTFALLLLSAPVLSAQLTNAVSTATKVSAELPDPSFSIMRVFGSLALVVGLFLGGVWLYKNWQRFAIYKGRTPRLQVIEVRPLGGRHALYLVACEQQRFLLASSPSGVNLISHLPDAEALSPATAATDFAQSLQRALTPQS